MGQLDRQQTVVSLPREEAMAILEDHANGKRRSGEMMLPDAHALGYNPVCGDRFNVFVRYQAGRILEVRYDGFGCVISRASASMMAETLEGLVPEQALVFISGLTAAVANGGATTGIEGDLEALLGVRDHPSRIKCVLLPWQAAMAALNGEKRVMTE